MIGTVELDDYRNRVEAFFDASGMRPVEPEDNQGRPPPSDKIAIFSHEASDDDPDAQLDAARSWRSKLAEAGFAWIEGPTEYGGAGLTSAHATVFDHVQAHYVTPPQDVFMVGMRIVAPTILRYGTEELRHAYLRDLYSGATLACQLFSEPGAGSDLAGLRTRATRHDGRWRVDGAKVWTSQAQLCDIGLLLARTEPDAPKHRGLTLFIVDMRDPAVNVRPLRQMNGSLHFNEVFLDGVWLSDDARVTEPGAGWSATISTLNNERAAIGDRSAADRELVERMLTRARAPRTEGAAQRIIREKVGGALCTATALELTNRRMLAETTDRGGPGARNSMLKLARNRLLAQIMDVSLTTLNDLAFADTGQRDTFAWGEALLSVPGQRIAGGTDEIQRSIVAERVLGLPAR